MRFMTRIFPFILFSSYLSIHWLPQKTIFFNFPSFFQIRHILENGSLYFPKFDATAFRQDVHWTVYKCIASNAGGTIISRDLSIKAGKQKKEQHSKWTLMSSNFVYVLKPKIEKNLHFYEMTSIYFYFLMYVFV